MKNSIHDELQTFQELLEQAEAEPEALEMADRSLEKIQVLYAELRSRIQEKQVLRAQLDEYFEQEEMFWGHIYHGLEPLLHDYYGFHTYCEHCRQEVSLGSVVALGRKCPECQGMVVFRKGGLKPSRELNSSPPQ